VNLPRASTARGTGRYHLRSGTARVLPAATEGNSVVGKVVGRESWHFTGRILGMKERIESILAGGVELEEEEAGPAMRGRRRAAKKAAKKPARRRRAN
jgi:hypothetical protein